MKRLLRVTMYLDKHCRRPPGSAHRSLHLRRSRRTASAVPVGRLTTSASPVGRQVPRATAITCQHLLSAGTAELTLPTRRATANLPPAARWPRPKASVQWRQP